MDGGIFLRVHGHLPSISQEEIDQVDMEYTVQINASPGSPLAGVSDTQYEQNGKWVTPSGIGPNVRDPNNIEDLLSLLEDSLAYQQDLTNDDGEKLAQLLDYLEALPKIDD